MSKVRRLIGYALMVCSWAVKGCGVALLLLVLVIAIGEGPPNPFELSGRELVLLVSFLVTLAGVVVALWRQVVGGAFIVAGIAVFIGESSGWVFKAFLAIGILNIFCGCVRKLLR